MRGACGIVTSRPDHHLRELGPRDVADAALVQTRVPPQNDDAIADLEDFRQLVGDEDDALSLGPKPSEDRQAARKLRSARDWRSARRGSAVARRAARP